MKYLDNKGNLKKEVEFGEDDYGEEIILGEDEAVKLVLEGKVSVLSDAVKIYYARKFYNTTEGAVGIESMYRRLNS